MIKKNKTSAVSLVLCCVLSVIGCKKNEMHEDVLSPKDTIVNGKSILYKLKNGGQVSIFINEKGENILGGDIILSDDQIAYLEHNKQSNTGDKQTESTFTEEFVKLWNDGVVYYTINDASNYSSIIAAINHWETYTPIRFVQRTYQYNYVEFGGTPPVGAGGGSQLGMVGGKQFITLSPNAGFTTVAHEIGHLVGLMHEQCRADRDQFINVNYSNIKPGDWAYQYAIYDLAVGNHLGPFDYNSLMIYPSYAASAGYTGNTTPQMTRKDGSTWSPGFYLSQGDIDGVNYLYTPIKIGWMSDYSEITEVNEYVNKCRKDISIKFYEGNFNWITLPKPITVKIICTRKDYNNHNYVYQIMSQNIITIPAGTQQYQIGTETYEEQYDQNMNEMDGSYSITYNVIRMK